MLKSLGGIGKRPLEVELVRDDGQAQDENEVNMRNQAERTLDAIVSKLFFILLKAT